MPPEADNDDSHSWHLFIVQLAPDAPIDRNTLIEVLKNNDIGCSVHYRPLHQMTLWSQDSNSQAFPEADAFFETCVSLPLFMSMTREQQDRVVSVIKQALKP
jgi:dTDP-4-amino-4,6-dideoxygalactose transaminase